MNLGKRIGIAFELAGTRAPIVARQTGVPVTSINALLRRGSKRSEYTEQILAVLPSDKVNHEWVRTGQGTPEPKKPTGALTSVREDRPGLTAIARPAQPAATSQALAAAPLRSWEYRETLPAEGAWVFIPKLGIVSGSGKEEMKTVLLVEDVQAFRTEWIREDQLQPSALAWSIAEDSSMETVLYKDDSYVVDTSDVKVVDGRTYAIWYSGTQRARKLFMLPGGGLRIAPNSASFESYDLSAEDAKKLRIIGRVVHRSGKGGL